MTQEVYGFARRYLGCHNLTLAPSDPQSMYATLAASTVPGVTAAQFLAGYANSDLNMAARIAWCVLVAHDCALATSSLILWNFLASSRAAGSTAAQGPRLERRTSWSMGCKSQRTRRGRSRSGRHCWIPLWVRRATRPQTRAAARARPSLDVAERPMRG